MKEEFLRQFGVLLSLGFILALFAPSQLQAAEISGLSLQPGPADETEFRDDRHLDYEGIEPGTVIEDSIIVTNNNDEVVRGDIQGLDAQVSRTGGGLVPKESDNEKVGTWIEFHEVEDDDEVIVPPNTSFKIPFTITVPETADVGEHNGGFAILTLGSGTERQVSPGASVKIVTRAARTLSITVPGEIRREVVVKEKSYTQRPNSNVVFDFVFENKGNVSAILDGTATASGIFGQLDEFDVEFGRIHRESEALRQVTWNNRAPLFGLYWTDFEIDFEEADESLDTRIWMFLVPWKQVALGLIIIFILWLIYQFYIWRRLAAMSKTKVSEYTVKADETLPDIARQYGISWKFLAKINKLEPPYHISKGDKIFVPDSGGERKIKAPSYFATLIKPFRNLYLSIVNLFTSEDQQSMEPEKATEDKSESSEKTATESAQADETEEQTTTIIVEGGDTLKDVAEWADTTQKHIAELNDIEYPYKYEPEAGEELIVPDPESDSDSN